ncbi:MAG: peptidoglycan editing factor PgeF [Bacteroidales bacterium]|nr:peptidoglycan editing factor PgeF [Bacteroidales bacterium]
MKIELLKYHSLAQFQEIEHFSSTRLGGVGSANYDSLNLSTYCGDDPAAVAENRLRLCQTVGITPDRFFAPYQTHEDKILVIDEPFLKLDFVKQNELMHGVDAIITASSQVCIGVTTADCVPILLYDPIQGVVASIHAGWRGTVKSIAGKTVQKMCARFGSNSSDILAIIGPSIGPDVYEVGEEVAKEFENCRLSDAIVHGFAKPHIDLWKANRLILRENGVLPNNIESSNVCTYTYHETYFSARRLGLKSGRCVTGIMIK